MMDVVEAPVTLLLAPGLSASSKLVWAVLRFRSASPDELRDLSGLSRRTVVKCLAQLDATGWTVAAHNRWSAVLGPGAATDRVVLPGTLLTERDVGTNAKLLYGVLQVAPGFQKPKGQATYAQLSTLAGISAKTVKSAVMDLVLAQWIQIDQVHQNAPVLFTLANPVARRRRAEVTEVRHRLKKGEFGGETLMREFLTLLVDRTDFRDEDDPEFLTNPETGERLRFDRFYPSKVAFEYNGPQHYGPTKLYTEKESRRQQALDLIKLGICTREGITMVIVHAEDLTLEGMRRKVGGLLPLRDLSGYKAVIRVLKERAYEYRPREQGGA